MSSSSTGLAPARSPARPRSAGWFALVTLAVIALAVPVLDGCGAARWQPATAGGSVELKIGPYEGYRLAKCSWYSETEALLAFWRLGEQPQLSLVNCHLSSGHLRQLFTGPFTVDCEDDLLIGAGLVGYQDALTTVTFDRESLALRTTASTTGDTIRVLSDDLRWAAEVGPDRLTITGPGARSTYDFPLAVNTTLRWSTDGSTAVSISSDRTALHVMDLVAGTSRTFRIGADIPAPPGFAELMYCWPLADGHIVLDIAGEDDSPLALLDSSDPSELYVLPGQGEMTTLATHESSLLYCRRDRRGGHDQLIVFECDSREASLLQETTAAINCASFSPDGARVLIGLHSEDAGNRLMIMCR